MDPRWRHLPFTYRWRTNPNSSRHDWGSHPASRLRSHGRYRFPRLLHRFHPGPVMYYPPYIYPWEAGVNVGVAGGIPAPHATIIDVSHAPYNADNTGATDAAGAINSAISAAAANTTVFIPAGL